MERLALENDEITEFVSSARSDGAAPTAWQ
jgi:hypothetical protein